MDFIQIEFVKKVFQSSTIVFLSVFVITLKQTFLDDQLRVN